MATGATLGTQCQSGVLSLQTFYASTCSPINRQYFKNGEIPRKLQVQFFKSSFVMGTPDKSGLTFLHDRQAVTVEGAESCCPPRGAHALQPQTRPSWSHRGICTCRLHWVLGGTTGESCPLLRP